MGLDNAGKLVVQAAVEIRELLMIEAHKMQDCRVKIAEMMTIH